MVRSFACPGSPMLLQHSLDGTLETYPDKTALIYGGIRWSYKDLDVCSNRIAATLIESRLCQGDRVIVYADNQPEFLAGFYGVLRAGGVFVPAAGSARAPQLQYLLRDAEPAALITTERLFAKIAHLSEVHALPLCLVFGADSVGRHANILRCLNLRPGLPQTPVAAVLRIDQDLAAIIYTSGSTGCPKGVMLSHHNMLSALWSVNAYLKLGAADIVLSALPLAFSYGLYQAIISFAVGATLVLERSFAFPASTLGVLERERATVFPGVPSMYAALFSSDMRSGFDLTSIRLLTNAAAALPEALIGRIREQFPYADFFSMYGMTECKRISFLPPCDIATRPASVGRGMPNQEHFLIDEYGERVSPGCIGELVVRGSHVMRGYWRKPEETRQRLISGPAGEIYLRTGDLFRTDTDGYLYFVARTDDIIKCGGEKVSPREIESHLCALMGVREAAVLGVPDERLGQIAKAFIVLLDGAKLTPKEIKGWCSERLPPSMVPSEFVILDDLPRTDSGKILKQALIQSKS